MGKQAIERLTWYFNRLRSMSPAEVLHRVWELVLKKQASRWQLGWARFERDLPSLPQLPLDINVGHVNLKRWEQLADQAKRRRFSFLGRDWPAPGGACLWHFDPVSGQQWPRDRYCFNINYRHADGYGDVKYVWEVNRLQYLQPIAALAAATGNSDHQDFVVREIEDWIDENPPFNGVHWPSGIELALRAFSVLLAIRLLGPDAFTDTQVKKIDAFLAASAFWLHRYPSRFSSANNHLIAEGFGLFVIGCALPGHPQAREWVRTGQCILEEEAINQIFDDGIGVEQSPTYTGFSLEMLLIAQQVGETAGEGFSPEYHRRVQLAATALTWFLDASGLPPRIGDDDEGRVIYDAPVLDRHYVASVVDAAFSGPDAPIPADASPEAGHLRNLLLGRSTSSGTTPRGVKVFRQGGYTVLRDQLGDRDLQFYVDHGPVGYLGIAAHGHADALAVWLHVNGKAVLADAGTYLYHSGGQWRDRFRGTRLHNTLCIAQRNSSRISGAFNWLDKARADLVDVHSDPTGFSLHVRHDGYQKSFGVQTHRQIFRTASETFTLSDWLEGPVGTLLDVEISFLAGEGIAIHRTDDGAFAFRSEDEDYLHLGSPQQLNAQIVTGTEDGLGWISPNFGFKVATSQLIFSGKAAPGEQLTTLLRIPT
jgi:hypothetical protein